MSTIEEAKLREHLYKETLKGIVKGSQNYSDEIKHNVISIIDVGRSPEEICTAGILMAQKRLQQ